LVQRVIDNQNDLKLKGFLIGNPGINSDWYYNINEYAFQTYLWSHALLPQEAYQKSVRACNWDQFLDNCSRDFTHPTPECKAANEAAYKYACMEPGLVVRTDLIDDCVRRYVPQVWDPYSVLAPTCHSNEVDSDAAVVQNTPFLGQLREKYNINTTYNPCIDNYTPKYMNQPEVIKVCHFHLHIPVLM
jgi:serine carboxypeptidase-like clade 2